MPDLLARLRTVLADRYTIERELGRGGMATVYLAHDRKHDRPVAVKVLRPELAASLGPARFLQEIKFAAGLAHPHILPLHDSGDADGFLYYVMPFVAGESLRHRLTREQQLPLEDALQIARAIADALAYAHSHDVVHRDVKPENILFEAGHAILSDFGIARAITAAGGEKLTETGMALGTPAYMSPEQASGDTQLDARSDVYSLGCVLYEMLAGEPPFTGPTAQAIMAKRFMEPARELCRVRETVPHGVSQAVRQALARVPADRFATAAQFAEALASGAPIAPPPGKSIAVLPFANLSADPENEYFSDGMTEEIINALTQIPALRVAARTSSFAFKGKNVPIRVLGEELQVNTVLEGSVRKAGNKLRITTQLVNVADGYQLWSERYDREMADVFAIQDDIAQAIVDRLKVKLFGGEAAPLVKRGTDDLDAYNLYIKGRHFWNQRALPKALECFQQAIARDPKYARAHAGVADVHAYLGHYGLMPTTLAAPNAIAAAEQAVALDESLADAHVSLGVTRLFFSWDPSGAERELRRAVALSPQHALARCYLALYLGTVGRRSEARTEAERAMELEPLSPIVNTVAGIACYWAREFQVSLDACSRAVEIDPQFFTGLYGLGRAYEGLGRHDEAVRVHERAAEILRCPLVIMFLGGAYADAGRVDDARRVLEELRKLRTEDSTTALSLAYVYTKLGEMSLAMEWAAKAVDERNAFAWAGAMFPGMERLALAPGYGAWLAKTR
ncbi:MAG: protein kinase domain-containing protein [Gemmatimonadales bacterium]